VHGLLRGYQLKEDSLLAQTRRALRRSGHRAKKALGQHFLIDETVLPLITAAAELTALDTVIEVGPGLGALTRELARTAGRVIAVEMDDSLSASLRQSLAPLGNVSILNRDILQVNPADLLPPDSSYKVAANLPYYITAPVLRHFLEATPRPATMVVMVQKEVAETIAAPPGRCTLLSVSVQFYGEPSIISRVPAAAFYPEPEVDSAILKIKPHPRPAVAVTDEKDFFRLVRAGFTAPRKQLVNSLAQGLQLSKDGVLPVLKRASIAPQRRAETLTLEEWAELWQASRSGETE